jgi:ABC-type sugar transport system ATPase subunit
MTVGQNLAFGLKLRKIDKGEWNPCKQEIERTRASGSERSLAFAM